MDLYLTGESNYSIYNINGKLISSVDFYANNGSNNIVINTNDLKSGIYFIKVNAANHASTTLKMIKK